MRAVRHMAEPKPVRSQNGLRNPDMGAGFWLCKRPGSGRKLLKWRYFQASGAVRLSGASSLL